MAIVEFTFMSASLNRLTTVWGVVPAEEGFPGAKKRAQALPSLYLLHGYVGTNSDWLLGSGICELANRCGIAVFCPAGENSFYLDDEVGGNLYANLIGRELVDVTRRLFPLSTAKEDTLIGGFSMGGYGALRNGLYYDDTFGTIFAFSSALLIERLAGMKPDEVDRMGKTFAYYTRVFGGLASLPGSDRDPAALAERYVEKKGALPQMYMACGTEDMGIEACRAFGKKVEGLPGHVVYEEWPGEHNWAFWNVAIEKAIAWWDTGRAQPNS